MLSGALVEGVHSGQASEPESLRAKIQQGILALQEGLLERGTEVSHPALFAVLEAGTLMCMLRQKLLKGLLMREAVRSVIPAHFPDESAATSLLL